MPIRKPYYTPDEIIEQINLLIKKLDLEAYKTDGRTQLYSGPHGLVVEALNDLYGADKWDDNHKFAFHQAAWENTKLLDQVPVGLFAENFDQNEKGESVNLYAYYNYWANEDPALVAAYGGAYKCADKVMRHASQRFAEAIEGDTFTTVCGAGLNKVFYEVELPAIIANKKVTSINDLSMDMVREIYAVDKYEAFRVICLAELKEVREHAQKTGDAKDWADYKARRKFFTLERKYLHRDFGHTTPAIKKAVMNIITTYRMQKLQAEIVENDPPSRPVASPAPITAAKADKPKAP